MSGILHVCEVCARAASWRTRYDLGSERVDNLLCGSCAAGVFVCAASMSQFWRIHGREGKPS